VRITIRLTASTASCEELERLARRIAEEFGVSVALSSNARQLVASFSAAPVDRRSAALGDCLAVGSAEPSGLGVLRPLRRMLRRRATSGR
jgi:hypothetical protein